MAHLAVAPPVNATTFGPLAKFYDRSAKDGPVPIINYLLGSHYNVKISGLMAITSTGMIINDQLINTAAHKLQIDAESSDGAMVEKIGTFNAFMYFYPGLKIIGHSELTDDDIAGGTYRIRYQFEDLATGDKITIDLDATNTGTAKLFLRETVAGVETTLVTQVLTAEVKEVNWELDFLNEGLTKFYYKEPSGTKTRIYNDSLSVNIGEAKASVRIMTDLQVTKTVYSDYLWLLYPSIYVTYDAPLTDRLSGRVVVWDTNNEVAEADWDQVYASDHEFTGERVIENGLIRLWIKDTPSMWVYGWNGSSWDYIGQFVPVDGTDTEANTLHDVVFERFNDSQCRFIIKYGIVDHTVNLRRGMPYAIVTSDTLYAKVVTDKERFALSVNDPDTQLQDFNQKKSDDASRGNPLNLSVPVTTFTFTDDSNVNTGLDLIDDNWFAWYNIAAADTLGWLGISESPIALSVTATSATELANMKWKFTNGLVVAIGILFSSPSTVINSVPKPFVVSDPDTYIKWRSNESIFSGNQKMFIRKKR